MQIYRLTIILLVLLGLIACSRPQAEQVSSTERTSDTVRFASYNVSMFRDSVEVLRQELSGDLPDQVQHVASIIQRVRPDVLALMEFDYDSTGQALELFRQRVLATGQLGAAPVSYPFGYQVASNTGIISGVDLNGDGIIRLPEDAFGFGRHPGQYAFALLSKYPLIPDEIRSFRKFRWQDMPAPRWPVRADGAPYYSAEAKAVFRISSKNHIDIPLRIGQRVVHVILAHPTPPVFDGPEDRNGLRNYDEIRLIRDYLIQADYLTDDQGRRGGLAPGATFVVMGDLNADPYQGDSADGAIMQLLSLEIVNQAVALGSLIPASAGGAQMPRREGRNGVLAHNTSLSGLRIDYVLPSANLPAVASGVF
ncbi:MAG: endonuclease/exonuclease/phosphatase family protein, partial [Saprospiraceae bacterium]|nr:endonuclease/exonuclease/phosphatase family protein [Saprospiraceae bacterium]